jgi:hypothetical protein
MRKVGCFVMVGYPDSVMVDGEAISLGLSSLTGPDASKADHIITISQTGHLV